MMLPDPSSPIADFDLFMAVESETITPDALLDVLKGRDTTVTYQGKSLLMAAVSHGSVSTVRTMLDHGLCDPLRVVDERSALSIAINHGENEKALLLISPESAAQSLGAFADDRFTFLMSAAQSASPAVVHALLPYSDPYATARYGRTALICAAQAHRTDNVLALIPVSDVQAMDQHAQSALSAALFDDVDGVRALLAAGARPQVGQNLLFSAIKNRRIDHARLLLPFHDPLVTDKYYPYHNALELALVKGCWDLLPDLVRAMPMSVVRQVYEALPRRSPTKKSFKRDKLACVMQQIIDDERTDLRDVMDNVTDTSVNVRPSRTRL